MSRQTRTRDGVTVVSQVSGGWRTEDDQYEIVLTRGTTYCDGPHPERYRDRTTGSLVSGYCYGGEEHEYVVGWGVFQISNGAEVAPEPLPTFKEALDALARHIHDHEENHHAR